MEHLRKFVIALLIPIFLITGIGWFLTDDKVVRVTEVINKVPDTQYCYQSEDTKWLICRLQD